MSTWGAWRENYGVLQEVLRELQLHRQCRLSRIGLLLFWEYLPRTFFCFRKISYTKPSLVEQDQWLL